MTESSDARQEKKLEKQNQQEIETRWFSKDVTETLGELKTDPHKGLSEEEAEKRLSKYGKNEIESEEKTSALKLFFSQFKSLLIIILIIAAIISASIGQIVEAIAIIIIVILAGIIGFIQEYQAGKSLDALKKMAAPKTTVCREGKDKTVETDKVVPGDIVLLKIGDQVPADCRIIDAKNLKVNESALTGESLAVEKNTDPINDEKAPIGDRVNMLYMGTSVSYGRGKAVVVNTGMKTEFGKIADMLRSSDQRKTPLQKNLDDLGKKIGIYAIILAALMSLLGVYRGHEVIEMFVWGVALAVAVIPEALPAVVTISIALGVRRMVKRKALIRKLPAVETLGSTNIICSDKTGTLTRDEMTIRKIFTNEKEYDVEGSGYDPEGEFKIDGETKDPSEDEHLLELLKIGTLCADTKLIKNDKGKWTIMGDPTEGAIVVAARKAGLNEEELRKNNERIDEVPFSSDRKRMTTIHETENGKYAYGKGALEVLLDSCNKALVDGEEKELTEDLKQTIQDKAQAFGEQALRVLSLSYKKMNGGDPEEDMIFAGIVGMIDPPREEVKDAIKKCNMAGIKPLMITGDHKVTAVAVAEELGIKKDGEVITGRELEDLSDEEIDKVTEKTEVYARISPKHKMKIVESLMKKGYIVTMTGDGVNDAPSLKKADIGVAMGIKGTDVSREASDMILTDDNFASIVAAIEEGRAIFENIKKYLVYLLSGNLGTVFAMVVALLASLPLPLMAVQVLFINFLMDGLIAIALGIEPSEPGIMNRKPRDVEKGILSGQALYFTIGIGLLIGIVTIGLFIYVLDQGVSEERAVTIFFATLIFARLFNGLNCRSFDQYALAMNPLKNKALMISILISIVLSLTVIYAGFLQTAFHTVPLKLHDWYEILGSSVLVLIVMEIVKVFKNKKERV